MVTPIINYVMSVIVNAKLVKTLLENVRVAQEIEFMILTPMIVFVPSALS